MTLQCATSRWKPEETGARLAMHFSSEVVHPQWKHLSTKAEGKFSVSRVFLFNWENLDCKYHLGRRADKLCTFLLCLGLVLVHSRWGWCPLWSYLNFDFYLCPIFKPVSSLLVFGMVIYFSPWFDAGSRRKTPKGCTSLTLLIFALYLWVGHLGEVSFSNWIIICFHLTSFLNFFKASTYLVRMSWMSISRNVSKSKR